MGCLCAHTEERARPIPTAPAVLIVGSKQPLPIEAHLREQGWQTLVTRWTQQKLDARFLRQFNVILLANYPEIDKDVRANNVLVVKPDYEEPVREALQEFVSVGGGLLTFGGDYPMDRDATNAFLKPWDIEVLREQVVDPAHSFTQKNGMRWVYLITDNIRQHPITNNVITIFYPTKSVNGSIANPLKTGSPGSPLRPYPCRDESELENPNARLLLQDYSRFPINIPGCQNLG